MIPGLREQGEFFLALEAVDEKHRDEPDFDARDWWFVDEEEAELHGDTFPDES